MSDSERPVQFINRVLVVEDDHDLANLLAEVLTYENYVVDLAGNGMEALEKLGGADYDAVVCDLMMPRVDGEALYNEVVKLFPYLADRFLFIAGQASMKSGLANFIHRSGMTLLEKPFEMDQFRAALRDVVRR